MPYARRKRYKKRYRKRYKPNRYKQVANYAKMAYAAYKGVQFIRGRLNTESKLFDVTANLDSNTTGYVSPSLCNPILGDTSSERSGRQIKIVQLHLKFSHVMRGATTSDTARMIIVRTLEAAPPTVLSVLNTIDPESYRNLNNTRDIQVLYDKNYNMDTAGKTRITGQVNLKLAHKIVWDIATPTTPDFGHIYVLFLGRIAGATNSIFTKYSSRCRYVDN